MSTNEANQPTVGARSRPARGVVAAAAAVLGIAGLGTAVLGIAAALPAAAHGGAAQIEVGDPVAVGELQIELPVRITYETDDHPVEEVEGLTLSGKGPDGAELAPVEAFTPADAPGVYRATVTLPVEGRWELTVAVVEPPGSATVTADVVGAVEEPPAPDPGGDGGAPDAPDADGADGDDPGAGSDDAADDDAADADGVDTGATATGEDATDEGGGIPVYAVVIAAVAAAAAGVVGYRWSTNRA